MKYSLLLFALAWLGITHAAEEEYTYPSITRRVTGQEINQPLTQASRDITVTIQAQKFGILIHDISIYTESTEVINFNDLKRQIKTTPKANGYILMEANSAPIVLNVDAQSIINGISIVAESVGGFGTLSLKVSDAAAPISPPTQPDEKEVACQNKIYETTEKLADCSSDSFNASQDITRETNLIAQLELALSRVNAPLRQCEEDKNNLKRRLEINRPLDAQLSQEIMDSRQIINTLRMEWRELRLTAGKTATCTVWGRHAQFTGSGPTLGQALRNALSQCGEGNCGKRDWDQKYRCGFN